MTANLKASAQRIQNILQEYGLSIQVKEFSESTRTSQEAATAIGCEVGQIAKTLIFKGKISSQPICVIASGINRVDEKKIETYVGEKIEKPDAEFVLKHTSFAIGGIPPIGYSFSLPTFVDEDLLHYQELWAAAGTPNSVFRINPRDLLRITNGQVINLRK